VRNRENQIVLRGAFGPRRSEPIKTHASRFGSLQARGRIDLNRRPFDRFIRRKAVEINQQRTVAKQCNDFKIGRMRFTARCGCHHSLRRIIVAVPLMGAKRRSEKKQCQNGSR
jgi:hypothetical protein